MISANGTWRKSTPDSVASFSHGDAAGVLADFLDRIKSSLALDHPQVNRNHDDRHQREGGGEREIACHALLAVHDLADVLRRIPDDLGNDVVPQCERECENGSGSK